MVGTQLMSVSAVAFASWLVVACGRQGSGAGDASGPAPVASLQGQYVDAPTAGLSYSASPVRPVRDDRRERLLSIRRRRHGHVLGQLGRRQRDRSHGHHRSALACGGCHHDHRERAEPAQRPGDRTGDPELRRWRLGLPLGVHLHGARQCPERLHQQRRRHDSPPRRPTARSSARTSPSTPPCSTSPN